MADEVEPVVKDWQMVRVVRRSDREFGWERIDGEDTILESAIEEDIELEDLIALLARLFPDLAIRWPDEEGD